MSSAIQDATAVDADHHSTERGEQEEQEVDSGWVLVMTPKNKQWVTRFDGMEKLELVEVDMPAPGEGEVLVQIQAVGLNYRDVDVCSGEYNHRQFTPSLQSSSSSKDSFFVPCSDMCGTVIESTSPLFKPGTRVTSIFLQKHLSGPLKESDMDSGLGLPLPGVLAQYRCFDARALVALPEYLTDEEACSLPTAGVTAWTALNWMKPVGKAFEVRDTSQETVLLQGTGAVSIAGLQIAKAAGLRTIVTSSSDERLKRATEDLGVDVGINHRTHWEWQDPVMKATEGKGADYILELGGVKTLRKSFASVAFGGTISCIGNLAGKEDDDDSGGGGGSGGDGKKNGDTAEWNRLNVNALAVKRNATLKGLVNGGKDRFEEMLRFYEEKKIRPVVGRKFGMEEAREAMACVKEGKEFGVVVIKVE